tara:strand:+ start:16216 stop:16944 length:729 start_codon:yes stop_codon:yes gene_type:complete
VKKTIIITGGSGKFAQSFKKFSKRYKILFPNKHQLNILSLQSISKYLDKIKPNYLIHNAALSRPMSLHEKDISKSIKKNIIGTCNVVIESAKRNLKVIYFSSNYVYEGTKGNYKENSPIKPINNYAWSKLGGECAVQMYKNSLILRLSITERPFNYKIAYTNVKSSFIYHSEASSIIMKLLDQKGIINVGGKSQTIFDFAKVEKKNILPKKYNFNNQINLIPKNSSLNLSKLKKLLKNNTKK